MTSHIVLPAAGWILLAAGWTDFIIPVVVFLVWLINQIAGANKAKPPQPVARPQPGRPGGQNVPGQPAAGGQRGLMDEVEQFLRDARKAMEQQQKPAAKPAAPQAARPPQPRPQPAMQQQRPQQQRPQPKQPRKQEKPVARQAPRLQQQAADRPLDDVELGGSVARHVEQHLDTTSRFEERAGRLSHLKQTVEQDIGDHVRHKFDHQVGTLSEQSGTRKDAEGAAMTTDDSATGPNSVVQIVAMLRDPQSMRNAIILQEILAPPTHRW